SGQNLPPMWKGLLFSAACYTDYRGHLVRIERDGGAKVAYLFKLAPRQTSAHEPYRGIVASVATKHDARSPQAKAPRSYRRIPEPMAALGHLGAPVMSVALEPMDTRAAEAVSNRARQLESRQRGMAPLGHDCCVWSDCVTRSISLRSPSP